MCEYCEPKYEKEDDSEWDVEPLYDRGERVVLLNPIDDDNQTPFLSIIDMQAIQTGEIPYIAINFCPMCGRKLSEVDK